MASSNSKAVMAASVAVLSWSTVAAAFKTALNYFSHYEMLLVAAATATVIFAVAVTITRKWHTLRDLSVCDWLNLATLGLCSPTLYYLVLFAAYDRLPAQVAQPINYCWPIFLVIMLALIAHKPVRPKLYIGMVISLAGVAVISLGGRSLQGSDFSLWGIALAFLSAVLWALYWIVNDRMNPKIDENVKLLLSFAFGTIYLLAGTLVVDCNFHSTPGILSSVYIGCFEMGIPFIFFSIALHRATNVALINQMCYIAPFMSLFFISIIVGEPIMPMTYLGLTLIILGVVYNKYLAYRKSEEVGLSQE